MAYQLKARSTEWNPTAKRLRELTEEMPNSQVTEFGNVAVKARVDARSTRSTYIVEDSSNVAKQTITRADMTGWPLSRTPTSPTGTWSWSTAT